MKRTITIRGRTGRYDVPSFVLAQNETLTLCFVFEETSAGVFRAILTHGNAPKIIVSLADEKSITITPAWILKGNTEPVCVTLQMLDPSESKVIKNDYYIEPLTMIKDDEGGFEATAEMSAQSERISELEKKLQEYGKKLEEIQEKLKDYIDNGTEIFLPEN